MRHSFRSGLRADILIRAIDLACHLALAGYLPGHFWYQFLPDVLLPVKFPIEWCRNKPLRRNNPLVWLHENLLHSFGVPLCLGLVYVNAPEQQWVFNLAIHWSLHLCVDFFTHDGWYDLCRDR